MFPLHYEGGALVVGVSQISKRGSENARNLLEVPRLASAGSRCAGENKQLRDHATREEPKGSGILKLSRIWR